MDDNFAKELMARGILSYQEHEKLWQIAKRCARTTGMPMAGAGAVAGLQMGTVTLPGIGTVAGPLAGALAGLFAGTVSCTMLNVSMVQQLRILADGQ